jgi:hypothetical protein
VDGLDDFGVVDALQVDGGDAEVAVAELAPDDDQRPAFASELDGMRMPQPLRRTIICLWPLISGGARR